MSMQGADGGKATEHANLPAPNGAAQANGSADQDDMVAKVAIAGAIGVGAALIEASLIPGILIGAAAVLAPKYLPGLRDRMRPLLKSTVRGVYKISEKTREAVAEAQEQVQDIMAEARHEDQTAAKDANSATTLAHHD
jgi:Protein of unknown function (DUF5132)